MRHADQLAGRSAAPGPSAIRPVMTTDEDPRMQCAVRVRVSPGRSPLQRELRVAGAGLAGTPTAVPRDPPGSSPYLGSSLPPS